MSSAKTEVMLGDLLTTAQASGNNSRTEVTTHDRIINAPVPREDILSDEWSLLINGEDAIASLQHWSAHSWPTASEKFAEDDAQIFLKAARVMAVASALSYSEQEDAQLRLGSAFWNARLIDEDNAQAMLYMNVNDKNRPPVMIVAFRGTELPPSDLTKKWPRDLEFIPDWIRNAQVGFKSYYGDDKSEPQVHKGFRSGWRALKGLLKEQIQMFYKERGQEVQLFVTGHSQGAALAGLSLLDLLLEQEQQQPQMYSVKGCLVLAAPKHGDKAYSVAVADAIARYQIPFDLLANQSDTGCDPVVCVPAAVGMFAPYAAPAGRLWIVQVGQKTERPATEEESENVVDVSLNEALRRLRTATPLHAIGSSVGYLSALRE